MDGGKPSKCSQPMFKVLEEVVEEEDFRGKRNAFLHTFIFFYIFEQVIFSPVKTLSYLLKKRYNAENQLLSL